MYDAPGVASPPFRADHVGSLLRPKELLDARARYQSGETTKAELRAAEDEAIRKAVAFQESVGLHGITDGEYRRGSWHMDFLYQFGGVEKVQDNLTVKFQNKEGGIEFTPSALRVVGKIKYEGCIFGEDFKFLQSVVKNGTPKLTIPAPSMMHYRGGRNIIDQTVYPDIEEFWADLGEAYAQEVEPSASSAAPTCSSTTPPSPTSTTRPSASISTSRAARARPSTWTTSRPSTPRSRASLRP
ncbi:MAG: hypothetical protein WDM92_01845 [Caulobacteraceae bacterium]